MDASFIQTIQGRIGSYNPKEVKVAEIRHRFEQDFDTSIGVEYGTARNNISQDFIITNKKNGNCKVIPRVGEILDIGDIILFNGLHWLVNDKNFQDTIYNSCEMMKCNREIRWQNPTTKEIVSRWCFAERPYANGVDEGKVISTSNRQFRITLPYDTETTMVDLDRRFLLEKINNIAKSYRLKATDVNTNKLQDIEGGFVIWTLEHEGNFMPDRDNSELMIADYIISDEPTPLPPDLLLSDIEGSSVIKCGMSPRQYIAKFYDKDNNIVPHDNIDFIWDIENPDDKSILNAITLDNGDIKLSCCDNVCIGKTFYLTLTDRSGLYNQNKKRIEVTGIYG